MASEKVLLGFSLRSTVVISLVTTLLVMPIAFYSANNIRITSSSTASESSQSNITTSSSSSYGNSSVLINGGGPISISFGKNDIALIERLASQSAGFLVSLQIQNGAIPQSLGSNQVYTRDLALAIIVLLLTNKTQQAARAIDFLVGLPQGSSYYTNAPSGTISSPDAWFQVYSTNGSVLEQSLRGEDQGMALFALATYYKATGDTNLISSNWSKIENSANFILYLQKTPGQGRTTFDNLYRHGDNWQDTRKENINKTTGQPIYWPYWPEYYQWEEENMRMIMGLKGAILLASTLGYTADADKWSASVNLALREINGLETSYNKYEAYDYFGSVLWGLQTNLTAAENLLSAMPFGLFSPYGIKDLPWGNFVGSADTVDYMTVLVRVGNYVDASNYLHIIASKFATSSGGFYNSLSLDGRSAMGPELSFSSSRFIYFASIALDVNTALTKF
jgi:hypothetical protein